MGKSGRALDMRDLDGRGARRRRGSRIWGVIGRVAAGLVAVTATLCAVVLVAGLGANQSAQDAYDKAPYCATDAARTDSCVLRTTAGVGYVDVSENTGKNAHGYTTKAHLVPAAGVGSSQTVELSDTEDLSGSITSGDVLPVLIWRGQITRFTFSGKTHDADANPHHRVAGDLGSIPVMLVIAFSFGRPLTRRLLRDRIAINLRRNRIPDWTLVPLAWLVVPVAAILRASYAVEALGGVTIAVLLLAVAWPFIPWVATVPDQQRLFGGASQNSTAAKNRNRAQAKKKLP